MIGKVKRRDGGLLFFSYAIFSQAHRVDDNTTKHLFAASGRFDMCNNRSFWDYRILYISIAVPSQKIEFGSTAVQETIHGAFQPWVPKILLVAQPGYSEERRVMA
jgi:hypothetical protein